MCGFENYIRFSIGKVVSPSLRKNQISNEWICGWRCQQVFSVNIFEFVVNRTDSHCGDINPYGSPYLFLFVYEYFETVEALHWENAQ